MADGELRGLRVLLAFWMGSWAAAILSFRALPFRAIFALGWGCVLGWGFVVPGFCAFACWDLTPLDGHEEDLRSGVVGVL